MLILLQLLETEEEKSKFEKLYYAYRDKMFFVANSILRNHSDAEDVVYDSFKIIIEHFEKIEDVSGQKTWNFIVTIVKNKSINLYNYKKNHTKIEYQDNIEIHFRFSESMELMIEKKEISNLLSELVKQLPHPYKDVLYLQYYNELKGIEIASILDKTPDNIRQISRRAKKLLEKELANRGINIG
ncbi:RNA polymerase sigma factor [Asaccharospora irregularis]|uniref:RNA polymerase sigma-70 factor, ECF subfamily n=1 Tax=Asaccharospora irregularis DSM 2635 TaxID=1121321 RepID=A0A1M5R0K3_9FIRM|nr:sigma-70 family RNA polymerase sigma factor [Asaccharospora irregularis]SHH19323.1 RNA polymerase sigma-70 factor, ECF subfamily [Asaccharospora irregularis DSM 2635]